MAKKPLQWALDLIAQLTQGIRRRPAFSVSRRELTIWLAPVLGSTLTLGAAALALAGRTSPSDKTQLNQMQDTPGKVDAASMDSRAQIAATQIPATARNLRTAGYKEPGDGGGGLYRRVASEPSHRGKVQSADGAWWELVDEGGGVRPEQAGAVANGTADDTAVIQSLHDAYGRVVGRGNYQVRGLEVRGTGKVLDFSEATLANDATDGTDMILMGSDDVFQEGTLALGWPTCGSQAGHIIRVVGTCRGSAPAWREAHQNNPAKSVLRAYSSEGAGVFGWIYGGRNTPGYTRGVSAHRVPLIDVSADDGVNKMQGNIWRFAFAYGSSYTGGSDPVPFMSLKATSPALLLNNDIYIEVGEILNGGAVQLERVIGSRIEVSAFDTGTWVGDMVRSVGGRSNTYKVTRKAGTRTANDWGSGAVSPFDVNLDDTAAFVISGGINGELGHQYIEFNGNAGVITSGYEVTLSSGSLVRVLDMPGRR